MSLRVLVYDHDTRRGKAICNALQAAGVTPVRGRDLVASRGKQEFDAVIAATSESTVALEDLCRRFQQAEVPVVAINESRSLADAERLFHAGATACLSSPTRLDRLVKTVKRLASDGENTATAVPKPLRLIYEAALSEGAALGDMAEIHPGVSSRHDHFKRGAAPSEAWRPVLTEDLVRPFSVGEAHLYLRFDRQGLVRVPPSSEYNHPVKVVVARTGPPVACAVDTSGRPVASGLYSILPAKGLLCGYLCALLNSRIVDFYLNRIRPLEGAPSGNYLRAIDLEAIPVRVPPMDVQSSLSAFADTLREIGPNPVTHKGRVLRVRALRELNHLLFDVYGFGPDELKLLKGMHF